MEYRVEEFGANVRVEEYVAGFRDEKRFFELCRACPQFGKSWACPPFDFDAEAVLMQYEFAHIVATKITPVRNDIPIKDAQSLILPERIRIEKRLLDMERESGGRGFAHIGKCLHCGDEKCTRLCKLPCRHPEKVRPSLEAFGFDIEKTLKSFFNIELLWGKDGKLPKYLVLVSALFHNSKITSEFSTKGISVITGQTTSTIYVRKSSVRKKLGVPEKEDIVRFLHDQPQN